MPATEFRPSRHSRVHSVDFVTGVHRIVLTSDGGTTRIDDRGIETSSRTEDTFEIHPDDPLSARLVSECRWAILSGEADTAADSRTELTATATHFLVDLAGRQLRTRKPSSEVECQQLADTTRFLLI